MSYSLFFLSITSLVSESLDENFFGLTIWME